MERVIVPGERSGPVTAPLSKSETERLLLAAALGKEPVEIRTGPLSGDVEAMIRSLSALGADIQIGAEGMVTVRPAVSRPAAEPAALPVGESAAVLRFLLPVAGALGIRAAFFREGRLPERPVEPLLSELLRHGMRCTEEGAVLSASGQLVPGMFRLPGNVSSQFATGLLFALPLLSGESTLTLEKPVESRGYLELTEETLQKAGVSVRREEQRDCVCYRIPGNQTFRLPLFVSPGGDYSAAAVFLAFGALSEKGVGVAGLDPASRQGDRKILEYLRAFGAAVEERKDVIFVKRDRLQGISVDASDTPDLVPVLAVLGAYAEGVTEIRNVGRLRLKESDRLRETARFLKALGSDVTETEDGLTLRGKKTLSGGTVSSAGDHRIAMAEALAAAGTIGPVRIEGAEAVGKSYPAFFETLEQLEQDQ